MNKAVKTAGVVMIAVFIILLFFSQTIYNFNTPTVTAVMPVNGTLDKRETSTGLTDWSKTRDLYAPQAGVIAEVYADEGGAVEAGGHIAKVAYDTDSITDQITSLAVSRNKLQVSIDSSQAGIDRLNQQMNELNADIYTPDDVSEYAIQQAQANIESGRTALQNAQSNVEAQQAALDSAQVQLTQAQKKLQDTQALFDVGGVSAQDLDNAQNAADTAQKGVDDARRAVDTARRGVDTAQQNLDANQLALQNQQDLYDKTVTNNDKSVSDQEKARKSQIEDWTYQIANAQRTIQSNRLDIKNIDLQTAGFQRQLDDYNNSGYIDAPEAGTILTLALQPGQNVIKGQQVATMALGGAYTVTCQISLDNNFVAVGDGCKLTNTDHTLTATVSKITLSDTGKQVEMTTDSTGISSGETFEVDFEKESAKSMVLVPNGAVNQDSNGYFIYAIRKRKGMLGDEYYAAKVPIYIGDSDDQNTILTSGMTFFEPVALLSDKPFSDGDTVKVKNEGDFFAS